MIRSVGFDRMSFRALAKELGISYGTVQNHFPTKDALWRALVDELLLPEITNRQSRESPQRCFHEWLMG